MVIDVKLSWPSKQLEPKLVTELGMVLFLQPAINLFVEVSMIALQFSLESYIGLSAATTKLSSPMHPEKHHPPTLVMDLGMVMDVKPLQNWKQPSPKLVTDSGMMTDVKPLQNSKQPLPKLVTDLGTVTDVKLKQREKQYSPKLVTELGIVLFLQPTISLFVAVSMIALQFSLESYIGLSAATIKLSRPLQLKKHFSPTLMTEFGMVIDVKPLQP